MVDGHSYRLNHLAIYTSRQNATAILIFHLLDRKLGPTYLCLHYLPQVSGVV